MNGKSIFIRGLAGVVLLFLTCWSCSTKEGKETQTYAISQNESVEFDLDQIKERGALIAVVDNSSTSYFLYRGAPLGYEYELLSAFCDSIGIDLEIKMTANMDAAFEMLNKGEADLMAYHLTITKERSQRVAFSEPHNTVRQVLVQRKPENWRTLKLHQIDASLIRNPLDLAGQKVHVRQGSSFAERLINLSNEIGEDIEVVEEPGEVDTESLIRKVVEGEIDFTIADEDVAMLNATYYPILDVETAISFPQKIAWAMRKNVPQLEAALNTWLVDMKQQPEFYVIYNKYFKSLKSQKVRAKSDFSTVSGGRSISPYDDKIKEAAASANLDWLLLASLAFQESRFDAQSKSWAGAKGLMQLTSVVANEYGVEDVFNPDENIAAGVAHLQYLLDYWEEDISADQRLKFALASYNVGQGHVRDAMKLAEKYNADPKSWEDVAEFLLKKSEAKYYKDPVVTFGYCRGSEPVNYVVEILNRYKEYQRFFNDNESVKVTEN